METARINANRKVTSENIPECKAIPDPSMTPDTARKSVRNLNADIQFLIFDIINKKTLALIFES